MTQRFSDRARGARRARVIAAGDCDMAEFEEVPPDDLIVCVDGGLLHCLDAGLTPDWLIGDLDSVPADALARIARWPVERFEFPPEKNASDLQLALELLTELPVTDVFMHGVSGGRTDHCLFNWMLPMCRHWPFRLYYEDRSTHAMVLQAGQRVVRSIERHLTFSVLALQESHGVQVLGARYPLVDAVLRPGDTLGLSNEADPGRLEISLGTGLAVVLFNKPKRQSCTS